MVKRDDIIAYLSEYLSIDEVKDACPNGLQVEGKEEVSKIITSVSASKELFRRSAEAGADMVIVHHGILWTGQNPVIKGAFRKRIKRLLQHDMNLLAYHLPLDRHPVVGNNVLGCQGLGLTQIRPFGKYKGQVIGFCGLLPQAMAPEAFFEKVNAFYGSQALVFPFGPKEVRSVGIISGGAQEDIYEAIDEKLDVYITGEVSEYVMHVALESGLHFVSAGHYATERPGIRALTGHLAGTFDVAVEYIDIPVPV
ncbi:MAG: Nif3-like dinuclear metal center hexameric protein [Fibrobacterota bacterium]